MLPISRGFWKYVGLTIITLGIYRWYIIHAFAKETNIACSDDGKKTTGLGMFILLSLVTLGIYAIVWQILIIDRRGSYLESKGQENNLPIILYVMALVFGVITLGILPLIVFVKFIHQQNRVNALYNASII